MATFGMDEIDGGEIIYEMTPEDIFNSGTWGGAVRHWSQFFDYKITELRSDHNHLAMQIEGPDPEVCKRLIRAYFDAATAIDAVIAEEAVIRHNKGK